MARRPRLDLDSYAPYLINRVGAALVARFVADPLARHDLSIAMFRVLVALSANGTQRQVDLGDLTSIDPSTLSRMVTRLTRRGLLTRVRSTTNSREVRVGLTARGRALLARLVPEAIALESQASAGIAPADLAALRRALRQMYRNISSFAAEPRAATARRLFVRR
jgi:DNA-binding MarR family transcriptional regulator